MRSNYPRIPSCRVIVEGRGGRTLRRMGLFAQENTAWLTDSMLWAVGHELDPTVENKALLFSPGSQLANYNGSAYVPGKPLQDLHCKVASLRNPSWCSRQDKDR